MSSVVWANYNELDENLCYTYKVCFSWASDSRGMKVSDLHIGKCASNHVIKQSFASKFMTWTFVQTYVNHYLWHSEDDIQKPSRHSRNTIVSTLQVFTAELSSSFSIGFSSGPTNTSKECHMNCCSKPLCFMFVLSCIVLNMIVLHLTDQSKAQGEPGPVYSEF